MLPSQSTKYKATSMFRYDVTGHFAYLPVLNIPCHVHQNIHNYFQGLCINLIRHLLSRIKYIYHGLLTINFDMFLLRLCRSLRPSTQCYRYATALAQEKNELNQAVTEAEKIVGYPTSFLNLRWILTDELANVALHLRKLIGINHPFLETARKLFFGNNMPAWGLIVLLVSKAYGLNVEFSEHDRDITAGVLHSQRALAEVTEMIRTSAMIHKNIANIAVDEKNNLLELSFGNKIALLSGDHLLSKSFHELACLRAPHLNELMSSALRDLAEAEFLGLHDSYDVPLPSKPIDTETIEIVDDFGTKPYHTSDILGNPVAEWTLRNILGGASLLGKSCQGSLMLAKHSEEVQHSGFILGKCIALAWQAKIEQEVFVPGSSGSFSLVSAPVMLHLKYNPTLYDKIEVGRHNALSIDYEEIRKDIQNGNALQDTQCLQQHFSIAALNVLYNLPKSDARVALENIIKTLL
ncbi:hypothetical protein RN001_007677 [Aquatica leii]|uniref:Decaprenyl-diphosphate synthase subunit 2 n=1 Tax=Aquatica leii TaxID=1421715 RepID=A0AAN7PDG4_9COLE|nr:hypothetical protein RN001_007677 [Aquatica leii]